jgi:ATP-dependent RNA helicase RhlE
MENQTFATLALSDPLLRAVEASGYTTPTPVQAQTIPAVLAGNDLMVCA